MGIVTILSCAVFGSITGSAAATLSCIGSIMFPKLAQNGFSRAYSASLMANASVLGLLIPPSGIMIIYSWVGGQSVLACFLDRVVPGIILIVLLSLINEKTGLAALPKGVAYPIKALSVADKADDGLVQ